MPVIPVVPAGAIVVAPVLGDLLAVLRRRRHLVDVHQLADGGLGSLDAALEVNRSRGRRRCLRAGGAKQQGRRSSEQVTKHVRFPPWAPTAQIVAVWTSALQARPPDCRPLTRFPRCLRVTLSKTPAPPSQAGGAASSCRAEPMTGSLRFSGRDGMASVVSPAAIGTIVVAAGSPEARAAPSAAVIAAHPDAPADVGDVLGEAGVLDGRSQTRRRAESHGFGAVRGQRGRRDDRQSSGDRERNSTHIELLLVAAACPGASVSSCDTTDTTLSV